MVIYSKLKGQCTVIQLSPALKYEVYLNTDHAGVVRCSTVNGIFSKSYLIIPYEAAKDIGSILVDAKAIAEKSVTRNAAW